MSSLRNESDKGCALWSRAPPTWVSGLTAEDPSLWGQPAPWRWEAYGNCRMGGVGAQPFPRDHEQVSASPERVPVRGRSLPTVSSTVGLQGERSMRWASASWASSPLDSGSRAAGPRGPAEGCVLPATETLPLPPTGPQLWAVLNNSTFLPT